jgi:hypothetical protein
MSEGPWKLLKRLVVVDRWEKVWGTITPVLGHDNPGFGAR